MKVSELEGTGLDRWVAKAEGIEVRYSTTEAYWRIIGTPEDLRWMPHRDWAQAGPIIERESISLVAPKIGNLWEASCGGPVEMQTFCNGRTPQEAAMRAYVAAKLGEEVPE